MPEQKPSYSIFGKQRRFSPELKRTIMQRLKQGAKPSDVEREFKLCYNSVAKFRRLIGDIPSGPGRKRKLTAHVIVQAEQRLRDGEKWADVAASCGVSPTTLAAHTQFRKRANR